MSTETIYQNATLQRLRTDDDAWIFRTPKIEDGINIHALIANCPPLDENSSYCNFLQSSHFNSTCIIAEFNGKVAGFISGYRKPDTPNELFVWQVAVDPRFRGLGLAFQMLQELLLREQLQDVTAVETTITESNEGSWRLFKKLDATNGEKGSVTVFLDEEQHFRGKHDTEYLFHIPLKKTH